MLLKRVEEMTEQVYGFICSLGEEETLKIMIISNKSSHELEVRMNNEAVATYYFATETEQLAALRILQSALKFKQCVLVETNSSYYEWTRKVGG